MLLSEYAIFIIIPTFIHLFAPTAPKASVSLPKSPFPNTWPYLLHTRNDLFGSQPELPDSWYAWLIVANCSSNQEDQRFFRERPAESFIRDHHVKPTLQHTIDSDKTPVRRKVLVFKPIHNLWTNCTSVPLLFLPPKSTAGTAATAAAGRYTWHSALLVCGFCKDYYRRTQCQCRVQIGSVYYFWGKCVLLGCSSKRWLHAFVTVVTVPERSARPMGRRLAVTKKNTGQNKCQTGKVKVTVWYIWRTKPHKTSTYLSFQDAPEGVKQRKHINNSTQLIHSCSEIYGSTITWPAGAGGQVSMSR